MALGRFQFYSNCIARAVDFNIILPNDVPAEWAAVNPHLQRPMKTLILLHGYSGLHTDWLYGSLINELSVNYNLAIICPSGENSFYLDGPETGRKYATYIGQELLDYARKTFGLSDRAEDTFIGGFSMGGFGAIHTALQFNHTFSKAFAFSSALIMHNIENMKPGDKDFIANYEYYKMVFGDLLKMAESPNNPEVLVKQIQGEKDIMPKFYLTCGTEDDLLKVNHDFRDFLKENQVDFEYHEGSGIHNWAYWNDCLVPAIEWLLKE